LISDMQGEQRRGQEALVPSHLASLQISQQVKTQALGRGRVLPSCGQAPHTARGHDCCPGCIGSYSQPGCVPAGASPREISFQNRCDFCNGKKQGTTLSKPVTRPSMWHMPAIPSTCEVEVGGSRLAVRCSLNDKLKQKGLGIWFMC
jgi:hypothetical protein